MRYVGILYLFVAAGASGQTETALQSYFQGKTVLLKLDLPAGKDGVDVYPKAQPMVDLKRYSARLRQYGPALRKGDLATVTSVRVKEKSIEFHLAGGAYGILSDDTSSTPLSIIVPSQAPQTHSLGNALFNIRYPDKSLKAFIPAPAELIPLFSEFVDFGREPPGSRPQATSTLSDSSAKLKKGMTQGQVLNLFGAPRRSREHREGNLNVVTNTFQSARESIEVDFVKNVVVDYRIRSR